MHIPPTILYSHPAINLLTDYFFVQGVALLHFIPIGYSFRTVKHLLKYGWKYNQVEMEKDIKQYIHLYRMCGICVAQLNTNNEFTCIKESIRPVQVNVVTAEEHVGEVERPTTVVTEGTRCHVHICSYTRYPRLMIVDCVTKTIKDLNQIPVEKGICPTTSPSTLVTVSSRPDYNQVKKLIFGDYVQVYINKGKTNTNMVHMVGETVLHPSGNEQGGWDCMPLATGKRIY